MWDRVEFKILYWLSTVELFNWNDVLSTVLCSIWGRECFRFPELQVDFIFQLPNKRCKLKSNVCKHFASTSDNVFISILLGVFSCNGLKYFDFSLKLIQILLLNVQVLRRLTSGILQLHWTILESRNADHYFSFPAFTISRSYEVMESWFQVFGCIENSRVHVIEQSDHKIKKQFLLI